MKTRFWVLALALAAATPVRAAGDDGMTNLTLCKESWLDWSKNSPAQIKAFGDMFRADFVRKDNEPFFVPKVEHRVLGMRVTQAFPQSVGMGVGFSLTLDAPFDKARQVFEKALGKPLKQCETGDDMRTCALEIADKRTFTLMAEDSPKATTTLAGCYYYYEK